MEEILKDSNCELFTIHPKYNPGFGGINPEPIEENLKQLQEEIKKRGADLGIATDGDADRVGVVDETGRYLSPLQVFSLLLLYLVEEKEMRGKVIKTVSLGYQPERISRKFGLEWEQTPVGFKYICEKMLKENDWLKELEETEIKLSEYDKYLLVKCFYASLKKGGKYLSKFYETLNILDAGWMSDRKSQAQEIFREIYDINVISYKKIKEITSKIEEFIQEENEKIKSIFFQGKRNKKINEVIEEIKKIQKEKFTRFKKKVLSKFVVSFPYRERLRERLEPAFYKILDEIKGLDKEWENRLKRWFSGIYVLDLEYDGEVGIKKVKQKGKESFIEHGENTII